MTTEYEPDAGDLIWTDFDPRAGREQGGRRPAIVISPREFWRASRLVIVCPITRRIQPFGTSVVLPSGVGIKGEILTSHVRSIDTMARPMLLIGSAPYDILREVRAKLSVLLAIAA